MGVRKYAIRVEENKFDCRPTDDGTKMEAPGVLVNAALDYAVTHVNILAAGRSDMILP